MANEIKTKIMSVMIALCFVVTAFVIVSDTHDVAATEPDGTSDHPYEITMFVGDSFSYTPTFSLTNVELTKGAGTTNAAWISVGESTHVVSGTVTDEAEAAGDTTLDLLATHTGGETNPLVQTKHMFIHFTLYKRVALSTTTPTPNYVLIGGNDFSRTFSVTTENASTFTPSYPVISIGTDDSYTASTLPSWLTISYQATTATTGTGTISVDASEVPASFQNKAVSITVRGTDSTSSDSITASGQVQIVFYIYQQLTVDPSATVLNQVEGSSLTPINHSITNDNAPTVTWSMVSQTKNNVDTTGFSVNSASGQLTYSGSFATVASGEYDTYNVTIRASASDYTSTAYATLLLNVWKTLVFSNTPSAGNVTGNKTNAFAITAVNSTEGSAYTIWEFGDGSVIKSYDRSTSHTYATSGLYKVKQTSYDANGVAFQPTYYLVEVGDGSLSGALNDAADGAKGFFEEHGYGVVIFGVLAAILGIMWFVMQDPRLLIGTAISAILAVVTFFANFSIFGLLF